MPDDPSWINPDRCVASGVDGPSQAFSEHAMAAHRQHRQTLHSELRTTIRNADHERALTAEAFCLIDFLGHEPKEAFEQGSPLSLLKI